MTEPAGSQPIHVSLEQGASGESKLTWSCGGIKKEIACKVVPEGILGRVQSAFLMVTQWAPVESSDFTGKHIQVFVQTADLEKLKSDGFEGAKTSHSAPLPPELLLKIEEFFGETDVEECKAEHFAARIQTCLESGGKTLSLDGIFNERGECPDIFDDRVFSKLEELSLKGIKVVPASIGHLGNLKSIDLSHSPIITLPKSFAKLKNIEYVNLACSGINKRSAVTEFGKEYMGGSLLGSVYEENGADKAVDDLFDVLKSLPKLKVVNMTSKDPLSLTGDKLDGKFVSIKKVGMVKFTEGPRWKME